MNGVSRGRSHAAAVAVALLAVAATPAHGATKPLYGTVERGYVSLAQKGNPVRIVPAGADTVIANFVWKRPPTAGQKLNIVWLGPAGQPRAAWRSTTVAGDRKGTRLWASVTGTLLRSSPGRWRARLDVGGVVRLIAELHRPSLGTGSKMRP